MLNNSTESKAQHLPRQHLAFPAYCLFCIFALQRVDFHSTEANMLLSVTVGYFVKTGVDRMDHHLVMVSHEAF